MLSGDYYSFVSIEGNYKVLKVLVVEDDVVHFCYYNNVFKERPSEDVIPSLFFGKKHGAVFIDINQGRQTQGCKHIALEIKGWDDLKPQFIVNSELASYELDAYEEWKVGDHHIFPSGTIIGN